MGNKDKVIAKYGIRWFRVSRPSSARLAFRAVLEYPPIMNDFADIWGDATLDLGILPCLLHYHLSSRFRNLLSDHSGQEHQQRAPYRGCSFTIQPIWRFGRSQGGGQSSVSWQPVLSTPNLTSQRFHNRHATALKDLSASFCNIPWLGVHFSRSHMYTIAVKHVTMQFSPFWFGDARKCTHGEYFL
jgi:hypothetical protein